MNEQLVTSFKDMMRAVRKNLRQFVTPPIFPDDEDKTRTARILNTLLLNLVAVILLAAIATWLVFVKKTTVSIFLLALLCLLLISHALAQRGRVLAAGRIFVSGMWVAFTFLFLLAGTMSSVTVTLYIALAVIAGALLSRNAAIVVALLSGGVTLGLAILESTGYPFVRYWPQPPMARWVVLVLALILTLTPIHLTIQGLARALARARESESRFRTLFEQAGDAIFLADSEGRLLDVNHRACESLGYSRAELLCLKVSDVDPEFNAEDMVTLGGQLQPGETILLETTHRRRDESTFPVEVRVGFLELQGQRLILGLARDITQRKQAEKERERLYHDLQQRMTELQQTQAQLIQSAKLAAVGELAAGVAHEVSNPLTSIMAFAQLVLWDTSPDDPRYGDLEAIASEANRAGTILRNLLTFARQTESLPEDTDINAIVHETLDLVRRHMLGDGIELVEAYAPHLPSIYADPSRLKQVFLNLINNARNAMQRGGRLTVTSEQMGDQIVVRVEDTGQGIPPEHLDRIFEPFFTTKPVGQGTGLGLSVSLGIVHDHGGQIEVQSQDGQGSIFSVWLPIKIPAPTKRS